MGVVDFWPNNRNLVQVSSDRDYFGKLDDGEQESIFLSIDDFFTVVDEYSEANELRKAWNVLKEKTDNKNKTLMREIENSEEYADIIFDDEKE